MEQYKGVAREVAKPGNIPFQTRREIEPFVIKAILVNGTVVLLL
jgi:hypothetical protein